MMTHCASVSEKETKVKEVTGDFQSAEISIDLEPWFQLAQEGLADVRSIEIVKDPLFKATKTYNAIPLTAVLDSVLAGNSELRNSGIIQFVCKDGYAPTHRLNGLPLEAGWLAFRDAEAPNSRFWVGDHPEQYGPFYLVWDQAVAERKKVSWPWGLNALKVSFDSPHASIRPQSDEMALEGFRLYEQRCIKCHSINKVGGLVGPELNFPKSITEYLEKEIIWQYTKDPRSFRYNSKMHGTEDITREEFELIYQYLSYMKGRKPATDDA